MPHPMNIKRTIAAVMSAPLLAGESIPNMANTKHVSGRGGNEMCVRRRDDVCLRMEGGMWEERMRCV